MKHPYLAKLLFLLLFLCTGVASAFAQTGTVSGRVVDEKNQGLPGVTVLVEGTTIGNSTNSDGTFSIQNVPAGPQTLAVSFVGYTTKRQPVTVVAGQNATVAIALAENTTLLNEAVVVGYGTQRRQDVTGSLTTVSSKDFVQGQVTNPEQLIQGKAAGVQITTGGGAPGAASTIRIRGGSSLNASNDPLIVIDGVPVDNTSVSGAANALSLINPNDIDTYTVLKDASATAIYGSRASNGVILITTKKGVSGEKLTVNVNSQTSLSRRYNSVPVLSADQFRSTVEQVAPNQVKLLGSSKTNWQDEIFRSAMTYDNTISLTGAVGKLPFRASYGNLEQQGILITNRLIRNTGSLSLNPVLLDNHLRVNMNVKGSWIDNNFADNGAVGSAIAFDPTQPVRSGNEGLGGYFEYLQNAGGAPQQNVPRNPLAQLNLTRDRSSVKRSIGNIQLDYSLHFLPDLHANLNLGYDITRGNGSKFVDPNAASTYFNVPLDPKNTTSRGGSFNQYSQDRNNKLLETYLNYTKQFGGNNRVELLAGYSYQDFVTKAPAYATYLADGAVFKAAATNPFRTQYTILSFYGRANVTINDRYVFTGTLRNDASSRFPSSNRNALFPAASLAWRIKEESFLKDNTTFSDLKLRVGYGITGQQDVVAAAGSDYPYIQRYTLNTPVSQYGFYDPKTGTFTYYTPYSPQGFNSNLKWEQTTTYNAGLDYGFLDGRLNGSVDVYYRKTKDLLAVIPIPLETNFTNQLVSNVGSLENKGVEFNLNAIPVQGEHWNWSINANATYNVNKILSLGPQVPGFKGIETNSGGSVSGGTGTTIGIYSVGAPSSSFYVYKQVYDTNGKPLQDVYADLNGDGVINTNDRYLYKQSAPKVILGFSSNASYDRLSLAFTLRSNLDNYVYNNVNSQNGNYQGILGSSNFLSNVTRDANHTQFTNTTQARYSSDYYIQNGSFLRMENVTLGYNVGKVFNDKGTLRLTAAVQNAFLITKYTGLDPEIFNGIDNNIYPRPRTFTFGLNLSL
ncbi:MULTISPECIES: SusC/RagA family TonB-linked outer membrane protein [Hymenobacter]|uniref:SusC/RagA family TonB-linked outer membrane protein n=1 Tax=Hymenobacter jejuensis TaxID=2502781 RepID=A0A5B7ZU33_9BACT|nr:MULTISPECIES: SusC/RagA family TonB-linked outer membrane protein [Hymenobacter]MBC6989099.1 SusC/RagA family TonB-linked outer membrane protein [Hymenobacter sp. BT491]QDA58694.1 SusC/RagA family TonB-linked outer membrane protein [Hymenobacter jejuensis]